MNILIFGSEGNIGKSLVKNFLKTTKFNLYLVDTHKKSVHKNKRVKYLSFSNKNFDRKIFNKDIDLAIITSFIMNFQEYLGGKRKSYLYKSELLIKKILKFIGKNKVKTLIYLSSIAVHSGTKYCTEKSKLKATTIYGEAKLTSEKIIREEIKNNSEVKYLIIRLTHIYGENIKNNFVNLFLKNKNRLQINGTGNQTRNLLHVDDLFSLIKKVNNLKQSSTINLASDDNISLNRIIKLIKGKATYNNINFKNNYPSKISYQKAKRMFNWSPKKKFTKYLKKYINK